MITNNSHKYSISAMCVVLDIPKSTYYYQINKTEQSTVKIEDQELSIDVASIFKDSRNNYGTRKIKVELANLPNPKQVSRRRIGRIMKQLGLVSKYTIAQFKPYKTTCNEAPIKNELQRAFEQVEPLAAIVSDLTYVRIEKKWIYVCLFIDLFNREIIGHSAGPNKTAALVYEAISSISANLHDVKTFHMDREKELDNKLISDALETFGIERSLSTKACPYDNAVAEAMFKVFKTEFANGAYFSSLEYLTIELNDYINWFNNIRIHGTLGYLTPKEFKQQALLILSN